MPVVKPTGKPTGIVFLSDDDADALSVSYRRYRQFVADHFETHEERHAAQHGYIMGVLDAFGITNPAAITDALSRITRTE